MSVNKLTIEETYSDEERLMFSNCTLCPRECRVNRFAYIANVAVSSDTVCNKSFTVKQAS